MGVEIPPSLQWVSYLVGSRWPQGDETAMFRIRDHWHEAAEELQILIPELNRVRSETAWVLFGDTAKAADEQFTLLFDGEYSVDKLAEAMTALGDLAGHGGAEIEYTKLQIIVALAIAATEITFAIANAATSVGGSLATIPVVEALTIASIRQLVVMLIQRISSAVASVVTKTAVKRLTERGAWELVRGVGIEGGIQGYQFNVGTREQLVAGMLRDVAITSAVGGVVQKSTSTFLFDALGKGRSVASAVVNGAAAGGFGTVAGSTVGTVAVGAPLDTMSLVPTVNLVKGGIRGIGSLGSANTGTPGPDGRGGAAAPTSVGGDSASRTAWSTRDGGLSDLRSGRPGSSSPTETWSHGPGRPEAGSPLIGITHAGSDNALPRLHAAAVDGDVARVGDPGSETGKTDAVFDRSTAEPTDYSAPGAATVEPVASGAALSSTDAGATISMLATAPDVAVSATSVPATAPNVAAVAPTATPWEAPPAVSDHDSTSGPAAPAEAVRPHFPLPMGSSPGSQPADVPTAHASDSAAGPAQAGPQHTAGMLGSVLGRLPSAVAARRTDPAHGNNAPGGHRYAVGTVLGAGDRWRAVSSHINHAHARAIANEALAPRVPPVEADELRTPLRVKALACGQARANAMWWMWLTAEQERALIDEYAEQIGNTEGLPASARNQAKFPSLPQYRNELVTLRDTRDRLSRAEHAAVDRYGRLDAALSKARAAAAPAGEGWPVSAGAQPR